MSPTRSRDAGRRSPGREARAGVVVATCTALTIAGIAVPATANADPGPESTVVVEANQPFRDVTHVATGSLYGIADDGVPSDDLIAAIKPNTFVQMPPHGTQQPTGDFLDVWETAARHDAGVVVRIIDFYPGWPYRFSWETTSDRKAWEDVVRDVVSDVEESGATNVVAWAPFNEPDITWLEENGDFHEAWEFTYNLLRELLGPDAVIQGPSFSDNISGMRAFLEFAVETDTVPDVLEWHELIRSSKIKGDVESINGMLDELGIDRLPIDIAEYAHPTEVGIPGALVGYVAKFERYGIDRAELAFWNQSGTLGDLLTHRGGDPNGAYWLYTWYADMSGQMVTTTPPSNETLLDAAAAVTDEQDEVRIITGGGNGATSVVVNGLDDLAFGDEVDVTLEVSPSYGRTVATPAPITISTTTYEVDESGSITVPIVMNPAYGYHVVVRDSDGSADSQAGTFTIENDHSGLLLTSGADGVVQAADAGSQVWEVVSEGSGLYSIVDTQSGLLLGIQDAAAENGLRAVVQERDGSDAQLWQLVPDYRGNVRLANYGTGLTLGVEDMSTDEGAAVIQWTDGAPTSNCAPDGPRREGRIGTALDFCQTASFVSLPDGIVSDLDGDWAISTWIKPGSIQTWSRVFDFGVNSSASMFLTVSAGNGPRFAITSAGSGGEQRLDFPGQNFTIGEWSHVALSVSGTTGTMYINGEPVATNDQITTTPADLGMTGRTWLGRSQYSSDPFFDGSIDDFGIFSRALTPAEIAELASGAPAAGDVAQYAFDEAEDFETIVDSSGSGKNGTVVVGTGSGVPTTSSDEDTADRFWTLVPAETVDETAPTVTVKEGADYTVGSDGRYAKVSFKLYDEGKIDRLTLNGVEKDLADNEWSDLNFVAPGVFGAVEGENTLVVYDVAGNATTVDFVLDTTGPRVTVKSGEQFTIGSDGEYEKVSFKLHDPSKIDRLTLNGVEKDLADNEWSDLNFVAPGAFGAVEGENTLVVYDALGNHTTIEFILN